MTESTDSTYKAQGMANPGKLSLHLQTQIQPDFMAALEAELANLVYERLLAFRQRVFTERARLLHARASKYISAFGLCLSVALVYMSGSTTYAIRPGLLLFFLFTILFFYTWDTGRLLKTHENFILPLWRRTSKATASRILKIVKKMLPFTAEYQFSDDVVTCYRMNSNGSKLAWTKSLKHCYMSGQYSTLLFKKKTSIYPYALIMHESPQELALYLDTLGLQAIPRLTA